MGFWDAVTSAWPYANNLRLAPDRNHTSQFLQAGCSSFRPANSVKALKALKALQDELWYDQENTKWVTTGSTVL